MEQKGEISTESFAMQSSIVIPTSVVATSFNKGVDDVNKLSSHDVTTNFSNVFFRLPLPAQISTPPGHFAEGDTDSLNGQVGGNAVDDDPLAKEEPDREVLVPEDLGIASSHSRPETVRGLPAVPPLLEPIFPKNKVADLLTEKLDNPVSESRDEPWALRPSNIVSELPREQTVNSVQNASSVQPNVGALVRENTPGAMGAIGLIEISSTMKASDNTQFSQVDNKASLSSQPYIAFPELDCETQKFVAASESGKGVHILTEDLKQKMLPMSDSPTTDLQSAKSVTPFFEQNRGADGASYVNTPAVSFASRDGKPAVLAISDDKGPKPQGAEKQPSAIRQDIGQTSDLTPKQAAFDPSHLAKNDDLQVEPKNLTVSDKDIGTQAVNGLVTMGKADPQITGLHRPQTPLLAQHVAQQLSVSVRQASDRTTEIALDPVELGRVQMQMKATDQSIVLTIMADRPETVDLMRRNIDILNQEFKALGYTSVTLNFSSAQDNAGFGMSGETGSDNQAGSGEAELTSIVDAVDAAPADSLRNADGSLDLRW